MLLLAYSALKRVSATNSKEAVRLLLCEQRTRMPSHSGSQTVDKPANGLGRQRVCCAYVERIEENSANAAENR